MATVKMTYHGLGDNSVLSVYFGNPNKEAGGGTEWRQCGTIKGASLPERGYFGFSASTGDLSDVHEILSLKVKPYDPQDGIELESLPERERDENRPSDVVDIVDGELEAEATAVAAAEVAAAAAAAAAEEKQRLADEAAARGEEPAPKVPPWKGPPPHLMTKGKLPPPKPVAGKLPPKGPPKGPPKREFEPTAKRKRRPEDDDDPHAHEEDDGRRRRASGDDDIDDDDSAQAGSSSGYGFGSLVLVVAMAGLGYVYWRMSKQMGLRGRTRSTSLLPSRSSDMIGSPLSSEINFSWLSKVGFGKSKQAKYN